MGEQKMNQMSKNGILCSLVISFCVLVANVYAADVTSDLVAHWPMDGNADDIVGGWNGEVGSGNPQWVEGHLGQGVELDGSSHIHVPDFELTTDTITFVAWINGWKAADWAGIVGSRIPLATEMIFGDNDTLHYVWNNNTMWDWAGGPVIPQNEWAMAVVAIESDKATAYIHTDAGGLQQAEKAVELTGGVNIDEKLTFCVYNGYVFMLSGCNRGSSSSGFDALSYIR